MSVYVSVYKSPFGNLTMASRGDKIIGLWLDGQKIFFRQAKRRNRRKRRFRGICPASPLA